MLAFLACKDIESAWISAENRAVATLHPSGMIKLVECRFSL
jgi:hypothetical protein